LMAAAACGDEANDAPQLNIKMTDVMDVVTHSTTSQWSWAFFDCGSFGFHVATASTLLPTLFKQVASTSLAKNEVTAAWGYTLSAAHITTCVLMPCFGSYADNTARRKCLTVAFALLAINGAVCAAIFQESWQALLVCSCVSTVGYTIAVTLYNSLLPFVFDKDSVTAGSFVSCALSNVGAAAMMTLVLVLLTVKGEMKDNIPEGTTFAVVGAASMWWILFNTCFAYHVPEPPEADTAGASPKGVLASLYHTLQGDEMWATRRFLLASFFLSEGIGVVYSMAPIYAISECGMSHSTIFAAKLVNTLLGCVFPLGCEAAVRRVGVRTMYMVLAASMLLALGLCTALEDVWQYWALQVILAFTGTGTFALSRSVLATLAPRDKASELFGFNAFGSQVAGVTGPLVIAGIAQLTGLARIGFGLMAIFVVLGIVLLGTIPADSFNEEEDQSLESQPLNSSYAHSTEDAVKVDEAEENAENNADGAADVKANAEGKADELVANESTAGPSNAGNRTQRAQRKPTTNN